MDEINIPRMMKIRQIYDKKNRGFGGVAEAGIGQQTPDDQQARFREADLYQRGQPGYPVHPHHGQDRAGLAQDKGPTFIVPAMGSHGGVPPRPEAYIAGYGITEASMGVPILSSMEVVKLGELEDGTPVYCDKYAYESDGIIVFNKVKPHTDFRGDHESGLVKMCAIGLANHLGHPISI